MFYQVNQLGPFRYNVFSRAQFEHFTFTTCTSHLSVRLEPNAHFIIHDLIIINYYLPYFMV